MTGVQNDCIATWGRPRDYKVVAGGCQQIDVWKWLHTWVSLKHTHTHTCTHAGARAHIRAHTPHTHACTHARTRTRACTCTRAHTHTYTHTHTIPEPAVSALLVICWKCEFGSLPPDLLRAEFCRLVHRWLSKAFWCMVCICMRTTAVAF